MFKYAVAVLAVLVTLPVAHAGGNQNNSSYSLTGGGRHFAIAGCYRSWRAAQRKARRINRFTNAPMHPARPRRVFWSRAINTSHYPNFRRGYKCAVMGPSSWGTAQSRCNRLSDYGVSCYVKAGF